MTLAAAEASDRRAVTTATLAAFLLIAAQVAARAVRDALFLSAFRVSSLPLVMGAAALSALAGAHLLSVGLSRRPPSRLVPALSVLSTVLLAAWWALGLAWPRFAAVGLYLHVAAFGGALVSGFWSMVNERFDPYTARKVVGRIAAGATAGGVAGGVLVWASSRLLPPAASVLVLAALSALAAAFLRDSRGEDHASPPAADAAAAASGLPLLVRSPYIRSLALVVFLGAMVEALVDFLFKGLAAGRFPAGASLLAAFGVFHAAMSVVSLLLQTTLSRAALRHLGIAGTLALRPALTLAGTVLGTALPGFPTSTLSRGAHESLSNSLFRTAYELLYTPLPEAEKRRVKALVDVAVDKVGTLAGSGVTALAFALFPAAWAPALFATAAALSTAALALSRRLHLGYVLTLEQSLLAGRVRLRLDEVVDPATQTTLAHTSMIDRESLLRQIDKLPAARRAAAPSPPAEVPLATPSPAAAGSPDPVVEWVRWARSGDEALVRRAMQASPDPPPALVAALLPHLAEDALLPEALRALRRAAPRVTGQLVDAMLDASVDPVVRRRIPRVLKASPTARAAQGLVEALDDRAFEIRAAAAAALAAIHERSPSVRIGRDEVLDRVRRELDSGEPVDRQLPQLFALLSLVLERGPLQIAWAAMRGHDRTLKGTALEYLANVLPPDVFPRVRSCFGASTAPLPRATRPLEQVADELRASSVGLRIEQPPWREGGEPG
jgi:ATP:ADP antiporter, AAA family